MSLRDRIRVVRPRRVDPIVRIAPTLSPSAGWNGTAGSGFGGEFPIAPTDPARTTAKPVLRLITPPLQRFTDELVVGVMAFAANGGTLLGGIGPLRFHFEGGRADIAEPTLRQITRQDGTTYLCLAYWVRLKKPALIGGAALLHIEALPTDPTMQNRVIGPFTYYPVAQLHDMQVTVGAAGDYTTLSAAMNAIKAAGAASGRMLLIDSADYAPAAVVYAPTSGYHKIVAAPGATPRISYGTGNEAEWRPGFGNLWFEGVEVDGLTVFALRNETNETFVAERCRFVKTGGRQLLYKNAWPNAHIIRTNGWFLNCYFFGENDPGGSVGTGVGSILIGNISQTGMDDFAEQAFLTAYNIVDDLEWKETFKPTLGRLRVQYSGSGTSITLSRSTSGSGTTAIQRFVFKVDGATVLTFDAWRHWSKHNAGDNRYTVEDMANAINAVSGFTATVLGDPGLPAAEREGNAIAARYINRVGGAGVPNVPDTTFTDFVIGTDYTFVANIDIHEDGLVSGINRSNIIHVFNQLTNVKGQNFTLNGATDMVIAGNIFDTGQDEKTITNSTIGDGNPFSHCVIVHNSWRGQSLRTMPATTFDTFSFVSNNVVLGINDESGALPGTGNIIDNTEFADFPPGWGTRAGTPATWFPGRASKDFTPAGELLTNLRTRRFSRDITGKARAASDAAGAVAA